MLCLSKVAGATDDLSSVSSFFSSRNVRIETELYNNFNCVARFCFYLRFHRVPQNTVLFLTNNKICRAGNPLLRVDRLLKVSQINGAWLLTTVFEENSS